MLASADDKASTSETLSGGQVTTKRDSFAASKVAIRTENLTRRYKNLVAVDSLNLAIHPGEIYGFLGANDAGKTTTMKMLVGVGLAGLSLATARVATTFHFFGTWLWNCSGDPCGRQVPGISILVHQIPGASALARPGAALSSILLLLLLLLVLVGPMANSIGKLYVAAFHTLEGRSGSSTVLTLPGIRSITNLLGRHRNLTGALLYKGLLNQSRNLFTWARLVIVLVGLLLFPAIRHLLAHYAFSNMFMVAAYSSSLAILTIIELGKVQIGAKVLDNVCLLRASKCQVRLNHALAPYAISSEGNRLALYLVTPLEMAHIL